MTVIELDNIKFVKAPKVIFQKAKRLLYKYGYQTPFTEEEMKKVLKILEIVDTTSFCGEEDEDEDEESF